MHREEAPHLGQDRVDGTGLEAVRGLYRVAVHWIARPHDRPAGPLHRTDETRQGGFDLVRAHAADQRDPAGHVAWIQDVDQPDQLVRVEGWAAFAARESPRLN